MTDKQRFTEWVTDHATTADSLDPQAPLDDLDPLGELIGDARVVGIGESAHYVREFYLLRHRLLRFLVQRCGFTVYAPEAPFTQARAIDAWIQGGPGAVEELAAAGVAIDLGRCREFYDQLAWMRAHNRTARRRLRLVGTDVPGSGGSPLPALEAVAAYLQAADPDALPLAEQAIGLVGRYHHPATFMALGRYATLEEAAQDALTAALSRLLARLESMAAWQASHNQGREHAAALWHLRGAWHLDHMHRDVAGRGLPLADAARDAFMAESVLRLLEDGPPDLRVVVASHNIHLQKTPIAGDGAFGHFPQGYHLAQALGAGYLAIAATSIGGRTAQIQPDPEQPRGFQIQDLPLPPVADGSLEAALATQVPLTIADLRAARRGVSDAASFGRLRMEGYFTDVPVFDAFDAVAAIPQTSCTEQATAHPSSPDPTQHASSGAGRPLTRPSRKGATMTGPPQAATASPTTATRTRPARQLPPRWRNMLLTTHIVVAVGVLGADLVLLTLGITGLAMGLLAEAVLLPLALAAPLTGILLGLGTPWGLTRHTWVLTKLVLTIAVATAAVFVLRPALDRAAAQALQVPLAELPTTGIGQLGVAVTLAPAAALGVLVAIVTLAVFKPWGQTRFRASLTRSHRPTRPRP